MRKKQRRLLAIMFTDIVGYSSMMQKDEAYATRMRQKHREVFQRWHNYYNGKILQYYGDGTLSVFTSTVDAVECAVSMQQSLKHDPKVPIRIGIHTGDITFDDEEIYGDGVNIAARVESVCVPGGVFISEKVYDDIKNHNRLQAKPIGNIPLKNIQQQVKIYAISNEGITFPEYNLTPQKEEPAKAEHISSGSRKKSRWIAATLAFFLGIFGLHRFYLGQKTYGIIYFLFFLADALELPGMDNLAAVPLILGFIDCVFFLSMPKQKFDLKYNLEKPIVKEKPAPTKDGFNTKEILHQQFRKYYSKALEVYNRNEHNKAIDLLIKAIEIKYDHPGAQFLLARCHALNENTQQALFHLEAAVAFGLDPTLIKKQDDLAYLRAQPEFETFEANNYRFPEIPVHETEILELSAEPEPDLLQQLSQLQKLRREGKITEQEYQERQKEIKSRNN